MAFILAISAAILCALNNLFMRRSIDAGGSSEAFLVVVEASSIIVAIFLGPIRTGSFAWNNTLSTMGLLAGLILGVMMWSLGRAMEKGPPSLTVAYLNASSVVPAIVMAMLFGAAFGHTYQWWNGLGSVLVVLGIFWAVWQTSNQYQNRFFWLMFASIAFFSHVVFLVILQWKTLIVTPGLPLSKLVPFTIDSTTGEWFMPMIFLSATIFLLYSFLKDERRIPKKQEVVYGLYGGVCNAGCTYFLLKVIQVATPVQSAMAFPLFAVCLILFCNVWGKVLYKENVHWKAMALCTGGLFVGTMDWSMFF